jgi:hypothetical protein
VSVGEFAHVFAEEGQSIEKVTHRGGSPVGAVSCTRVVNLQAQPCPNDWIPPLMHVNPIKNAEFLDFIYT